jgi:hypothetical protein
MQRVRGIESKEGPGRGSLDTRSDLEEARP